MSEKANALGIIALAELFHDTYERLAPAYGYETRPETREFNQHSNNGRLMIATVRAVKDHLARAQQPSAAQSGWISVEERLPEPFTDVLIYPRPTDYCMEGQVDMKGQWAYTEYEPYNGAVKYRINPTHWQSMPPPPTLEQFKKENNG